MKYLITQLLILILSVTLLYYFGTLEYFLPYDEQGNPEWYRIATVVFALFMLSQSVIALIIFLSQKFLAFGWKEFPDKGLSLKWALGISFGLLFLLVLHLFHLLSFTWGLFILILLVIAVILF